MKHIETDFIKIDNQGQHYYGGNQDWLKSHNQSFERYGCGVVAMCNLELCIKNKFDNTQDYIITFGDYNEILERKYKENYHFSEKPPLNALGLLPVVMKRGLYDFLKKYNKKYKVVWAPTIKRSKIVPNIKNMLNDNIPVVASYHVFNKRNKLNFYVYDEKRKIMIKKDGCTSHYFNITGIAELKNKKEKDVYFIISSWGKKYYINIQEWLKKVSYFTNILYVETYSKSDIMK